VASLLPRFTSDCEARGEEVLSAGGLYVLGTERHESRRIDNQLRGRSGRQGDPGESRFYLSLEDDLMRLFSSGMAGGLMDRALPEDVPIESKMVTKAIERAQTTVEQKNAEVRKNVLKYDEVMNEQRRVIYRLRDRVLDGAVAVFDGVAGVEPQTETVWRQADRYNVPRLCFINKMDRTGADFYYVLGTIRERLGCKAAVVQLPIGAEADFAGVIDLVEMNALIWTSDDLGASWDVVDIPGDLADQAEEYRHELIDILSEFDENILEKYIGEEEITADDIRAALRTGTLEGRCVPILTGTAFKNKGVQPLLDAVVSYLPSPLDLPPVEGVHPSRSPPWRSRS
jgi:translation elongation factor EF-G